MINPKIVPEAVVDAYVKASQDGWSTPEYCLAAALNAWPGMKACEEDDLGPACLILPLTEKTDDKA